MADSGPGVRCGSGPLQVQASAAAAEQVLAQFGSGAFDPSAIAAAIAGAGGLTSLPAFTGFDFNKLM
eukprot:6782581-Pyramimonas_sp.AAC.1